MKHLSREEVAALASAPKTPEELELIRKKKELRRNKTVEEIQEELKLALALQGKADYDRIMQERLARRHKEREKKGVRS